MFVLWASKVKIVKNRDRVKSSQTGLKLERARPVSRLFYLIFVLRALTTTTKVLELFFSRSIGFESRDVQPRNKKKITISSLNLSPSLLCLGTKTFKRFK